MRIQRVHCDSWRLFRQHHYLSGDLHRGATCFCAFWRDAPVAFVATLHMPHPRVTNLKREHRLVCLPDYQGIGIGAALSDYIASMWRGLGFRYRSITSHPGVIATRYRSPLWRMVTAPGLQGMAFPEGCLYASRRRRPTRLRAAFEFVGTPMERTEAAALLGRC